MYKEYAMYNIYIILFNFYNRLLMKTLSFQYYLVKVVQHSGRRVNDRWTNGWLMQGVSDGKAYVFNHFFKLPLKLIKREWIFKESIKTR